MTELWIAVGIALVALLASIVSVEFGVSIAIVEIVLGVAAANFFGLETAPWVDFLAAFGFIVLTFLAGAEVDVDLLRTEFKGSLLVGGVSFLAPFVAALLLAFRRGLVLAGLRDLRHRPFDHFACGGVVCGAGRGRA